MGAIFTSLARDSLPHPHHLDRICPKRPAIRRTATHAESATGCTVYVQHSYCAKLFRMGKSTNITLKVTATLARDAKVFAARRGTSLSRLVAGQLETLVYDDQAYAAARRRALRRLKRGYDLGWKAPDDRAALHDRENLR